MKRLIMLATMALAASGAAWAEAWPSRPVTLLVPFPPGGSVDIMARQYSEPLSRVLGVPIVDIGMRMLQPRELYRAQGFPEGYVIERDPDGTPFTKTAQVRMVGNSVCPPVSEALVRANLVQPLAFGERAAD